MKHKTKKWAVICTLVCVLALVLSGCGVQVTTLELQLPESVAVGESVSAKLTAEYDKPDAKDEEKEKAFAGLEIVWASSDEAVATVDETGTVMGIASGRATITAAAGNLKAEKEITVLVPLEGVSVPETLELALNKTESAKLEVKPVPENASTDGKFSYTSSDEAVATVDETGTVTAKANGEAVITVTLEGKRAETRVTVTTAATGIGLEKSEGVLYVGGSYTIKAYTEPEDAPQGAYTYTSSDSKIATVSDAGVITAKSAGTAEITVKSAEGFTAVYTITVKNRPATGGNVSGGSTGGETTGSAASGDGGSGTGTDGNNNPPPPSPPPAEGPACGLVGPGHTEVGYCPICDITNGGWGYIEPNGQQGNGLEGDAW